jgi:DNA-binding response OmpR family regulator
MRATETRIAAAPAPATPRSVLVVEDEQQMRTMLEDNLQFDGYQVTAVETGEEALAELERHSYSLILLDVMLPGISGVDVCRRLRSRGTRVPVIMLTARTQESDRVEGLDVGADDYVTKPFSLRELLARVHAQVRRDDWRSAAGDEFSFGDVKVLLRQRLVTRKGRRVAMSAREFELLRYLIAHRNEVVSREQLLRDVWGYHELAITRTVDNYVSKLRTQLEAHPHEPRYLVTLHGSGYQLLA